MHVKAFDCLALVALTVFVPLYAAEWGMLLNIGWYDAEKNGCPNHDR